MGAGDFLGPLEEEEKEDNGDDDNDDEEVEVPGVGQRSRKYKPEQRVFEGKKLGRKSERYSGGGYESTEGSLARKRGDAARGGGGVVKVERGVGEQARFLETFVFLEEFLKELFCALQAKSHVETDARGLSESHRQQGDDQRGISNGVFVDDGDGCLTPDPNQEGVGREGRWHEDGGEDMEGREGAGEVEEGNECGDVQVAELPTSLAEFLRTEAFPVFVSPPGLL